MVIDLIRYFYIVEFRYLNNYGFESCFDLGTFSTKKNAQKKIEMSINLSGFKDYSIDNFKIFKIGVNFDNEIFDKSKAILYYVCHEYELDDDFTTNYIIYDYWSTHEKAEKQVEYLKLHSRIGKKYPNNFMIIENKVDLFNCWSEGFDKVV